MKATLIVLLAALLPSAALAQQQVVGMSEGDLISCAGIPQQARDVGQDRFFQYSAFRAGRGGNFQNLGGFVFFDENPDAGCDATVTIRNGKVTAVKTRPSGAIISGPLMCRRMFSACRR